MHYSLGWYLEMTKKVGRNKDFCKQYKAERRREKSHIRKIQKHLKRFPDDANVIKALEELKRV